MGNTLTKEEISERRKKVAAYPISTLACDLGYSLKPAGKNYITLKEHDSVMIKKSDNTYRRFSDGSWGDTLSFLMCFGEEATNNKKFKSISYSLFYLEKKLGKSNNNVFKPPVKSRQLQSKKLVLPKADEDNDQVIDYLTKRGISKNIIDMFIEKKMLYQEKNWKKNCIFVSYENDKPVFAMRRSSNFKYKFVQDIEGSDYSRGFFINNNSDTLVVTEACIETMSLMTLKESDFGEFNRSSFFCMNSIYKSDGLINTLKSYKKINLVILALNNDEMGRKATERIKQLIHEKVKNITVWIKLPKEEGFDWNDTLCKLKKEVKV